MARLQRVVGVCEESDGLMVSWQGDSPDSCVKTHQPIHQWNTVRSVPKPNVFDTPEEEAYAKGWVATSDNFSETQ
jgi:hypothetical protein